CWVGNGRARPSGRGTSDPIPELLLAVGLREALGHGLEHLVGDARHVVDGGGELALAHHQQVHVGVRGDRRVAGQARQQRELSEVLAALEGGDLAPPALDRGLTVTDQEELPPVVPLLGQDPPRLDLDLVTGAGQTGQLLARAGREQPCIRQMVDLLVCHRGGMVQIRLVLGPDRPLDYPAWAATARALAASSSGSASHSTFSTRQGSVASRSYTRGTPVGTSNSGMSASE